MFHERMGGCFSSNIKTVSYLRKLPNFLFNDCMNATVTAKHEYYIAYI